MSGYLSWKSVAGLQLGLFCAVSHVSAQEHATPGKTNAARNPECVVNAEASPSPDLRFITPTPFVAAFIRPRAILSSPQTQVLPVELLYSVLLAEVGTDLTKADEILLLFGLDSSLQPVCAFVCHYNEPGDRAAAVSRFEPQTPEATQSPARIYRTSEAAIFAAMPDDHTLLLAPESELRGMLSKADRSNPLINPLRQLNSSDAFCVVCDMAQIQAISLLAGDLALLPPEWQELAKLPTLMSSLELRLRTDAQLCFELVVHAGNDNLEEINRLGRWAIATAHKQLDDELAALDSDEASPVVRCEPLYFKRLLSLLPALIERHQEHERLVLGVKLESLFAAGVGASTAADAAWSYGPTGKQFAESQSNLQRIGTALKAYYESNHALPRSRSGADGKPLLSWRVHLLPFLGEQKLYEEFHFDESWDSEHNRKLIERMPAVYHNPDFEANGKTSYLAAANAAFSPEGGVSLQEPGDNAAIALVVETNRSRAAVWTSPSDFVFDANDIFAGLGGVRSSGFLVLTAGGETNLVSFSTEVDEVRRLFHPAPIADADRAAE